MLNKLCYNPTHAYNIIFICESWIIRFSRVYWNSKCIIPRLHDTAGCELVRQQVVSCKRGFNYDKINVQIPIAASRAAVTG